MMKNNWMSNNVESLKGREDAQKSEHPSCSQGESLASTNPRLKTSEVEATQAANGVLTFSLSVPRNVQVPLIADVHRKRAPHSGCWVILTNRRTTEQNRCSRVLSFNKSFTSR